jgi:integrase/recombinase XerD
MEDSYESAAALVCTIRGATAEHLVAFVGSLIAQQYSVSYVCQLAQHALAFGHWCEDTRTEIPPIGMLPHRSTRARPHLYTEAEVRRLLVAALELPMAWPSTPLRPWVFHCLIGLLSVTGLRISEALNLELGDVDLEDAVLTIRGAKLGRSRLVPIHLTTCTVLADYLRRRKQFLGRQVSSYVFVTSRGTQLDMGRVHRTFYALSRQTGLRAEGASKGPTSH